MRLGETIKYQPFRAQLMVDFDSLFFQLKRSTQSTDRPSMVAKCIIYSFVQRVTQQTNKLICTQRLKISFLNYKGSSQVS